MDENVKTDKMEKQKTLEAVGGVRPRKYTDTGKEFSEGQIAQCFNGLKVLSEKIIRMISDKEHNEAIRVNYSFWMQDYEQFLMKHQTHFSRLHEIEQEEYMQIHTPRDVFLMNCKREIQQNINSNPVQRQESAKGKSVRSAGISSVSSKRLEVEEKRIKLEAKRQAMKRKRELEMAKTALQLNEDELQMRTEIAVADAKAMIYDKFERGEIDGVEMPQVKLETIEPTPKPLQGKVQSTIESKALNPVAKSISTDEGESG
ncbi:unnamed protein product [Mytilus coruscus]|uniref:Uncharacterized protein n=1 Tax=Mytilus coruscus TaxID=42192 RepID=A0A6J8DDU7_MYTCO|nr:unnamed protein product [Mytilus coruscus]